MYEDVARDDTGDFGQTNYECNVGGDNINDRREVLQDWDKESEG